MRTFSAPAILTAYFGVVAHGENVYRESLDLLEYLIRPASAMHLHERFGDEGMMHHLRTQIPCLDDVPKFDFVAFRTSGTSVEQWTADALRILGASQFIVRARE